MNQDNGRKESTHLLTYLLTYSESTNVRQGSFNLFTLRFIACLFSGCWRSHDKEPLRMPQLVEFLQKFLDPDPDPDYHRSRIDLFFSSCAAFPPNFVKTV